MELKTEIRKVWPDMELGEELDQGSYGHVYNANWQGTEYALKIIPLTLTKAEYEVLPPVLHVSEEGTAALPAEIRNGLLREVRILQKLRDNPHIVWVEDSAVLKSESRRFCWLLILMEKLTSLGEYISRGQITEELIVKLGSHICRALEACEELSILHRDIKPSNILVDGEGNFLLADFGQSRMLERSVSRLSVQGTDSFMSPEVSEHKRYDHRADIYSLGLVLYVFLNHRMLPFMDDKSIRELAIHYDRQKYLAISRRMDGTPLPPPCDASEEMAAVILKACSYNPEDRFRTAKAFRIALETKELPPEPEEAPPSMEAADSAEAPEADRHKKRILAYSLPVLLLLVILGLTCYSLYAPAAGNTETAAALTEAGLTDHVVEFTDPTLETVIRKKVGRENGDIMLSDIWSWDTFSCCQPYEGARDTDLSYIDNSLWGHPVTDVSCLGELTNLETLYLSGNSPRDLSQMQDLDALETLDLRGCTLESLDGLQNLQNLTSLNLANVKGLKEEDFQVLTEMKQLKYLNLQNTGVTDLSFLEGMDALEELDLRGNPIRDYSPADTMGIYYIAD